ncbi:MAG: hypothetical protein E7255_03990 [Lachnospiraceae bacterium]|jgi:hypothetical protein|nr:hypothetical protein [Lachnospiraceae bacterium]
MMAEKSSRSITTILIGLILWFLYICDSEMARYGIYTIFSYNVHEILSGIPYLCFLFTGGWLLVLITRSVHGKNIKSNLLLLVLLFVFCVAQFIYIHNQSQKVYTDCIASIKNIDTQKLEIEIDTGERTITLDCPMLLIDILKTDGTEYVILYEWSKSKPNYGKLSMVSFVK